MSRTNAQDNVLVVGATSSIARALAGKLAARGARLHLAGRNAFEVSRIASDLRVRHGATVTWTAFDATDRADLESLVANSERVLGRIDTAVIALGELGDQGLAERDGNHAAQTMWTNFTAPMLICMELANRLAAQRSGRMVALLSVAGDRGRRSNYVYGSAKGGLDLFLQGLRSRLHQCGVAVTTVRLGFVDTKMTFGMAGLFLVAAPEAVAAAVLRAADRRADVVYVPWFWRPVMFAVRSVPERFFKRLAI
jgi:decaprenylphospho-beta-D-erythro-pentofuranosid-2-ulose 2-reductase